MLYKQLFTEYWQKNVYIFSTDTTIKKMCSVCVRNKITFSFFNTYRSFSQNVGWILVFKNQIYTLTQVLIKLIIRVKVKFIYKFHIHIISYPYLNCHIHVNKTYFCYFPPFGNIVHIKWWEARAGCAYIVCITLITSIQCKAPYTTNFCFALCNFQGYY